MGYSSLISCNLFLHVNYIYGNPFKNELAPPCTVAQASNFSIWEVEAGRED